MINEESFGQWKLEKEGTEPLLVRDEPKDRFSTTAEAKIAMMSFANPDALALQDKIAQQIKAIEEEQKEEGANALNKQENQIRNQELQILRGPLPARIALLVEKCGGLKNFKTFNAQFGNTSAESLGSAIVLKALPQYIRPHIYTISAVEKEIGHLEESVDLFTSSEDK